MSRVLFLVPYPAVEAGHRYRIQQFLPDLERAGFDCTVRSFASEALFRLLQSRGKRAQKTLEMLYCSLRRALHLADLARFDLVVIHREVFPFFTPAVERWVLNHGRRVVFSFDDALYAGHADVSETNHPWLYYWKYGHGFDEVLGRSHHIVAGSRILADYARTLNPNVTMVPTVIDCERRSYRSLNKDGPVTVGWMGSRSTAPYLSAIAPALGSLARAHPGKVRFRFFGCPEFRLPLGDFQSLPFSLETEWDDLASLDIGLMPAPDTAWTRGKCAFKAVQYMAAGAVTMASPVGAACDLIRHNENGFLAESPDEWFELLDLLVRSPDLRRRLSLAARRTVEQSHALALWGPRVVELFSGLIADAPQPARQPWAAAGDWTT